MAVDRNTISRAAGAAPLIALIVFVIAFHVPFLDQAFHMDDAIYLLLAQNIRHQPWFPHDVSTHFEGLYADDLASTEHPLPLTLYLMALSAYLVGGFEEAPLHLGFLIFPILLTCGMHLLANRFTRHPVIANLTLLTLPVVYVLSHTLMTDLPLLSIWVVAVALFVRGVDTGRRYLVWLGASAAALASLVSYSGLCLVPLLSAYAFMQKNTRALIAILILPAATLTACLAVNFFHYERFTPSMLLGYYFFVAQVLSPERLIEKSAYIVLALGGATIFPAALLAASDRRHILIGATVALAAILGTEAREYDPLPKLLFALFFCAGFASIAIVACRMARSLRSIRDNPVASSDDLFLSAWCLGMLAFCAIVYMTGSARYILPATPPLVLLLVRRAERLMDEWRFRWAASASLALGAIAALSLAVADYQFAQVYRDFASTLSRTARSRTSSLWFTGEWGFRAYLERLGAKELGRRDPRPRPGDLLAVPTLASPYQTLFSEKLSLESIVLVAPSRIAFQIPPVPPESLLVYTLGMPFHDRSDGMDFGVRFVSGDRDQPLRHHRLIPPTGRRWRTHEVPLREIAGIHGGLVFSAEVGESGKADADWVAMARARVCVRMEGREAALYDFRSDLQNARIDREPGLMYHTPDNLPVFPMTVWLVQEPAVILRSRHEYRPASPIRLLDAWVRAGFWSAGWGLLPYSIAADGSYLETISVYEVVREVDSYGETSPSWYPE